MPDAPQHHHDTDEHGIRIKHVPRELARVQAGEGVPVHGAPATGVPLLTNGHLGADILHVEAGREFPVHTHPGDHLLVNLGGQGTITVAGVVYETRPGDIYMVEGLVPHAVGAVTDHDIMAIGAPHKAVDAEDRMEFVDWDGTPVGDNAPVLASETAHTFYGGVTGGEGTDGAGA